MKTIVRFSNDVEIEPADPHVVEHVRKLIAERRGDESVSRAAPKRRASKKRVQRWRHWQDGVPVKCLLDLVKPHPSITGQLPVWHAAESAAESVSVELSADDWQRVDNYNAPADEAGPDDEIYRALLGLKESCTPWGAMVAAIDVLADQRTYWAAKFAQEEREANMARLRHATHPH